MKTDKEEFLELYENTKDTDELWRIVSGRIRDARMNGLEDGLRMYAWWKDGIEYVGTCGTTLKQAIERLAGGL